jgi:surface polysaccharide O-acyltransferase-like enzyme
MDKQRLSWVDLIRVVAIIGVLLIHSASRPWNIWGKIPVEWWQISNIYTSMVVVSVPLFFMLSGALLLGKVEPYSIYFPKRVQKLVIPWLVWSIIFLFWQDYYADKHLTVLSAAKMFINGNAYFHLWFIYWLMGIYLIMPLIRLLVAGSTRNDLIYFVGLWFVIGGVLPFVLDISNIKIGIIALPQATGYLGYTLLGYLLRDFITSRKGVVITFLIYTSTTAIVAVGTYLVTLQAGKLDQSMSRYLTPVVMIQSVSAFIILRTIGERLSNAPLRARNLLRIISDASFGMYLIHPIWRDMLADGMLGFTLHGASTNPLLAVLETTLLVLLLSLASTLLMQRIPLIKLIVPK